MKPARLLTLALREPTSVATLTAEQWTSLVAAARAESLIGALAHRVEEQKLPPSIARLMEDARADAARARTQALWEAEMARRALAPTGIAIILMKGTAYVAAGLDAGTGRSIGDLDIMLPLDSLNVAQQALLGAGWEWVKEDAYDDLYYRQWMHELPPLIHKDRDRMIDVHHTILPLTAKPRPDAPAMVAASVPLESGLSVLAPADMVIHSAAHLFADGDLTGGLRNLWDIDRLLREFGARSGFWEELATRCELHQLHGAVSRALRLAASLYGTPVDPAVAGRPKLTDRLFEARLLARNGWGQPTREALRFAFYVRSHLLRMPPLMLARHLLIKARRPKAA
jgi:hypothetical protein